MKVCSTCKIEKPFCEFYNCKKSKGGKASSCKICVDERGKKWREDNKSRFLDNLRKYYLENKEKLCQIQKEYRKKNKDKMKIWRKNWIDKNPCLPKIWAANKRGRDRAGITSYYVKSLLIKNSDLKMKEIPEEIVEVKKLEIQLKRLIKEKYK